MVQPPPAPVVSGLPPATSSMTLLVAAVIVHDKQTGRVLLLQRGPKAKFAQGMWDLPVGKSEPGEPITATAVREVQEETGLILDPESLRLAHVIHGAWGVEAPTGFLTVVFVAEQWSGQATNTEPGKHAQVSWTEVQSIPSDFVPTTASALARYLNGGPQVSLDGWPTT
jgi:8-oxo-dGTP pyrophosphatase MutT (NUDIX family)